MDADILDEKYIRIAELSQQIEQINKMISLHQPDTTQSMIRQYPHKRDELINELQVALQVLHLNVQLFAA